MPNHGLTFTPRGRGGRALDGTGGARSRYLPFSDHTLSSVQKFQRFLDLSPFFSYSCALFLHSFALKQTQPFVFKQFRAPRKRARLRSNKHSLFTRSSGVV